MPCTLTYGEFLTELQATWDVTLVDKDAAVGDPLCLKREVNGAFVASTAVTHRMDHALFEIGDKEKVQTILRRLQIPAGIFNDRFMPT